MQDEKNSLARHLHKHISSLSLPTPSSPKPKSKSESDPESIPTPPYISPAGVPPPSDPSPEIPNPPSLYSSSLISQADDPEDQTVLVLPDWKVVHDIENSKAGAEALYEAALSAESGRAGGELKEEGGTERRRSWVLPYRAVVLLCEFTAALFYPLPGLIP